MTYYRGLPCPTNPEHGRLLDYPTEKWAFYCPHRGHEGSKDEKPSKPFFTTDEAEQAAGMQTRRRSA